MLSNENTKARLHLVSDFFEVRLQMLQFFLLQSVLSVLGRKFPTPDLAFNSVAKVLSYPNTSLVSGIPGIATKSPDSLKQGLGISLEEQRLVRPRFFYDLPAVSLVFEGIHQQLLVLIHGFVANLGV